MRAGVMAAPLGGALVVVGPDAAGRAPRTCPRSAEPAGRAPCTGCVTVAPAASTIGYCPILAELGSSRWSGAGSEGAGVVEELAGVSVVRKSL